jgi:predicted acyl esterase
MDPDTVLKATQNWPSHVLTPTTGTASWRVGSAAGNTLTFTAPAMQIIGWSDTDRDGVSTDTQTFKLRTGTGGDNELVITQS